MTLISHIITILSLFVTLALANTEKTIFLAPELFPSHPTISDLRIHTLTPANNSLRTQLTAEFPSPGHPEGVATWLILNNLTPNQRYEVRVCWAATQPTSFTLTTYPFSTVFTTPSLLSSLNTYSLSHHPPTPPLTPASNLLPPKGPHHQRSSSTYSAQQTTSPPTPHS